MLDGKFMEKITLRRILEKTYTKKLSLLIFITLFYVAVFRKFNKKYKVTKPKCKNNRPRKTFKFINLET